MEIKYKSIYVVSVNSLVTGGPESLHQLAHELKKMGFNTYVYYIDTKTTFVPDKFKKYGIDVCTSIEDSEDNLLITPEVHTEIFSKLKKINKVIWWLSLDYYLDQKISRRTKRFSESRNIPLIPSFFILLFFNKYKFNYFKFEDKNIFHLFNCEYVRNYLVHKGIENRGMQYLCGPISRNFYSTPSTNIKENIVIYNPKKDNIFIQKIIKKMSSINNNIKFVPIQKMSEDECLTIMDKSKVYIDFGTFPGPERLPREAVLRGCIIITGLEGSAKNNYDVPIKKIYKFEKNTENITDICLFIDKIINNYDNYKEDFTIYKKHVIRQIKNFSIDVNSFITTSNDFFKCDMIEGVQDRLN